MNDNQECFFDALEDPAHSGVCVVKLIMTHALRNGMCEGKTLNEVIQYTLSTEDRTVVWKHPNQPVLPAFTRAKKLDFDKPANTSQALHTLRSMALISGIVAPLNTRAIRNGSARDVAHLDKPAKGGAKISTALALGHSRASLNMGVTQAYVGPTQAINYNL